MITILGTSHVSKRSQKEVKEAIATADVVAIELDQGRAEALMSKKRATFAEMRAALGLKAAVMASVMRWFQEKIAKDLGVVPGIEMKEALIEARKRGKVLALIDRPIQVTMQRLSKNFGWQEIKQMAKDSFRRQQISIHPDDDLVMQLLEQLKDKYPGIYTVMVTERDRYMAHAAQYLETQYPEKNILIVVGKAHVPGLAKQITYINKEIVVNTWSSQKTSANTSSSSA